MQISYQDWSDFLLRVGAVCSPAELHGVLCGLQCRAPTDDWRAIVREFMDLLDDGGATVDAAPVDAATVDAAAVDSALEAQYDLIGGALLDGQYNLQLLLPDEILPVATRAKGLALWCQGFLHGFGGAGGGVVAQLDEETREALADLVQIAQLDDSCSDSEDSEQDLLELVEYARMTVFSIVAQLRPAALLAAGIPHPSATRH